MTFKSLTIAIAFSLFILVTFVAAREIQQPGRCLEIARSIYAQVNDTIHYDGINALAYFSQAGDIAVHTGNSHTAIVVYSCALDIESNYYPAYHGRGLAYIDQGNYELALQDFLMALDFMGHLDNPELYQVIATTYLMLDDDKNSAYYYSLYLDT